jgi:hypothetical protein
LSVLPNPEPPTTMIHTGSSDAMIKFAVTAAASVNPHWRSQCEANLGQGLVPAAGAVPGEDVEYSVCDRHASRPSPWSCVDRWAAGSGPGVPRQGRLEAGRVGVDGHASRTAGYQCQSRRMGLVRGRAGRYGVVIA